MRLRKILKGKRKFSGKRRFTNKMIKSYLNEKKNSNERETKTSSTQVDKVASNRESGDSSPRIKIPKIHEEADYRISESST